MATGAPESEFRRGLLERLSKVLTRFSDPNKGTQDAAIRLFLTVAQHEGVDLKTIKLVPAAAETTRREEGFKPSETTMAGMRAAFREMRIPSVEENQKLQAKLDENDMLIAGYKKDLKDAVAIRKSLEKQVAKITKAADKAAKKTADESKLVDILKSTLVAVCAPMNRRPMVEDEFKEIGHRIYGDQLYAKLISDLKVTIKPGGKIPPWLRIVLRQAAATPPKKREPKKKANGHAAEQHTGDTLL